MTLELSSSRVIALPREELFDRALALDLATFFAKGAGPIPAIDSTEDIVGSWAAVGDSRRIHLKDNTSSVETMTSLDRPTGWTYELSEIEGPLKLLVGKVEGRFGFTPAGTGTEVTWSWRLTPKVILTAPLLHVIGFFWKKFAATGLASLEREALARR